MTSLTIGIFELFLELNNFLSFAFATQTKSTPSPSTEYGIFDSAYNFRYVVTIDAIAIQLHTEHYGSEQSREHRKCTVLLSYDIQTHVLGVVRGAGSHTGTRSIPTEQKCYRVQEFSGDRLCDRIIIVCYILGNRIRYSGYSGSQLANSTSASTFRRLQMQLPKR